MDWDSDGSLHDPGNTSEVSPSSDEDAGGIATTSNSASTSPSISASFGQSSSPANRNVIWFAEKDNPLLGSPPSTNSRVKVKVNGEFPVDYFLGLITEKYMNDLVEQSCLYAFQNGKENFKLTISELKVFLGITLVMTYVKYPRVRLYWSSDTGLKLSLVAENMTINRYEEIRRYLHFTDSSRIPADNRDKLIKIRPFLDFLHKSFHNALDPEEFQSIDEMMIPFKGRSSLKNYLPKKPKKWGYKTWVRAGVSGYVFCFELYQGASEQPPSECGASGDVVLRFCHDIHHLNVKVYADNFFSSLPLVRKLKEIGVWYVGTCRENRLKDAVKKLKDVKDIKKGGRGSSSIATSSDGITVARWFDNNVVHTISSYAGIQPMGKAKRWCKRNKEYVDVNRPVSIEIYNKHMGGVDLMDSLVALYRNDIRNSRWYMRIFYHMLNVAVVNAWLLWRKSNNVPIDLLEFKSRVANGLIFSGKAAQSRKRGRSNSTSPSSLPTKKKPSHKVIDELRLSKCGHYPKKIESNNANRCRDKRCTSKTRYMCGTCLVPLCPDCFESFHS
ncbi:piggyBac transposable element-derived protein 3-like [Ischnura elegans]|uniref:piggyBac transposable element-derived protein 3-like n=1 Tax=Ischnura elegans TaxID=197161 RepID=UPI001ED8B2A6|nr:piggyBac transposable element-derived protein 3-like [Ischnura elegans]